MNLTILLSSSHTRRGCFVCTNAWYKIKKCVITLSYIWLLCIHVLTCLVIKIDHERPLIIYMYSLITSWLSLQSTAEELRPLFGAVVPTHVFIYVLDKVPFLSTKTVFPFCKLDNIQVLKVPKLDNFGQRCSQTGRKISSFLLNG